MKFFGKNWTEDTSGIVVSSGAGTSDNIWDRNVNSQWASVGSNDGIAEALSIWWPGFKTFDHICLRNFNLKSYHIYYRNPAWPFLWTDFAPLIQEFTNADGSVLYGFTPITTQAVLITTQLTNPPNDEKRIGEFMCYLNAVDIIDEWLPESEDFTGYTKKSIHEKQDGGSLVIVETMYPKYQNAFEFAILPKPLVEDFLALKLTHQSTWLLPDDDDLLLQYYVNWENDFNFQKIIGWDPATGERCYKGTVEVKET